MRRMIRVKQRDYTDCGAACLASIAAFYNLKMPVSKIRQSAGTDKKGTNVIGLIEAAEKMGFVARGARGNPDSLAKVPMPVICHLVIENKLHHYVVVYKANPWFVNYMDPATGYMVKKEKDSFLKEWSGVLVLIEPGTDFKTGNHTKSNLQRFWALVQPHKSMMLQALAGAIVFTLLGLSMSLYVQKIVDHVLVDGNFKLLNLLSIVMIVLLIFQLILGSLKSLFALQTGQQIDARLILGYYKHILKMPQRFFDTMRVGEILSRINDAVKIRGFVNDVALGIIVNLMIIVFSVGFMFLYYWKLALVMLAVLPCYIILYILSNTIARKQQRALMEDGAELETQLVESLNLATTIKKFGLEQSSNYKTESRFTKLLMTIYSAGLSGIYLGNISEFVTRLFTILLFWCGSYFVIRNELSPGELLSFYALAGYLTSPAASLIAANRSIQDALIAADRLYEIIDLETESDAAHAVELTGSNAGDIVFDKVSFRYGTRTKVFDKLDLRIVKGISTAIVGESGSGKSTIAAMLHNLYPLNEGVITIGGIDLKHISKQSLRKVIAVVPQHIDLFAGSIIENIAPGDPEPDIQRIVFFCGLVGINNFIEQLPQHYYSLLNENGVNLSGGQRQRLAIARALYREPEILILDEATSGLDPASERHVQQAFEWFLQQGKTLIIIAHRLSTIRNCDRIIVLDNGKLVESGNHDTLLESAGVYAALWNYHTNGNHT